jgi:cobalt/nickel transport protein
MDKGWDEPVGLPTEIVPLLRPFDNYVGRSDMVFLIIALSV